MTISHAGEEQPRSSAWFTTASTGSSTSVAAGVEPKGAQPMDARDGGTAQAVRLRCARRDIRTPAPNWLAQWLDDDTVVDHGEPRAATTTCSSATSRPGPVRWHSRCPRKRSCPTSADRPKFEGPRREPAGPLGLCLHRNGSPSTTSTGDHHDPTPDPSPAPPGRGAVAPAHRMQRRLAFAPGRRVEHEQLPRSRSRRPPSRPTPHRPPRGRRRWRTSKVRSFRAATACR